MNVVPVCRRIKPSEEGYTMLAVIFLMAILALWLAVALPKVKQEIQRDREQEALHRGKQYMRAIQLYYRKFHVYPPSLNALKNTDDIRFLRKDYIDPITGKNDWQPILFGENKVPVMGFFGEPLGGATVAGTGPGGAGLGGPGGIGSGFESNSSLPGAGTSSGQMFGGPNNSGIGLGEAGASSSSNGTTGGGDTSSDSSAPGGQTFGGAGVIGVTIPSEKQALLVYKGQDHYNGWEFVYDPRLEAATATLGGGNANGLGNSSSTPANGPGTFNGNLPANGGPGQGGNGTSYPWNLPPPTQQ
jgi:type II secretory pathway pseudopilin PulG